MLLLAHTNAAIQEFARRTKEFRPHVRTCTIDSFCLELIAPYAVALTLPTPIRRMVGVGPGRIPFSVLAPKAVELLTRCPSIALMLAERYPVVVLDEHQDARPDQHQLVSMIAAAGRVRMRVFGDPMQAIFDSQEAPTIPWVQLQGEARAIVQLSTPQRWTEVPELGNWVLRAREELAQGRPLPLRGAPSSVHIHKSNDLSDIGHTYGRAYELAGPIMNFLRQRTGSAAVLTRLNNGVWGLHAAAGGRMRINEGQGFDSAYGALSAAAAQVGRPADLAKNILGLIDSPFSGMTKAKKVAIAKAIGDSGIIYGRQKVLRPFLASLEPLFAKPDLSTYCEVVQNIAKAPPAWLKIRTPEQLRVIGQLRPPQGDDPLHHLDQAIALRKSLAVKSNFAIGTVHKAKGLEFDSVMVANFSATHFGTDALSRRIAYVAISRAKKSLLVSVPGSSPSPLLG